MPATLIIANWKMNKGGPDGLALAQQLKKEANGTTYPATLVVLPPFTALAPVCQAFANTPFNVGGQDCFFEREGAFTGAIAATMLAAWGARYVLVGHSERRMHFHETLASSAKRVTQACEAGLIPIVCVGETQHERQRGATDSVIRTQLLKALSGPEPSHQTAIAVAYEPVWAIGTGNNAMPDDIQRAHRTLRQALAEVAWADAMQTPIVYGGSVKASNAKEILFLTDVDGALVGGASLSSESFLAIAQSAPQRTV